MRLAILLVAIGCSRAELRAPAQARCMSSVPPSNCQTDGPAAPIEGEPIHLLFPNSPYIDALPENACNGSLTLAEACAELLAESDCPAATSPIFDDPTWGAANEGWNTLGGQVTSEGTVVELRVAAYEDLSPDSTPSYSYVWTVHDTGGQLVALIAWRSLGWCCGRDYVPYATYGDIAELGICRIR